VGHCGVAVDSAADMDAPLRTAWPAGDVTTSMTSAARPCPVFCMYLVAAEAQGVRPPASHGTLQTDIFKEYIAQKEWLFPRSRTCACIGD
jgi:methylmalonyl-CoA mutase N-terminal domain/subunit